MVRAATTAGTPVTPASLLELATTLADLADADVMRDAWQ